MEKTTNLLTLISECESEVYKRKDHAETIQPSSDNMHVFLNLSNVIPQKGEKADILRFPSHNTRVSASVAFNMHTIDAGLLCQKNGLNPIVGIHSDDPLLAFGSTLSNQTYNRQSCEQTALVRSTLFYPLRSRRYREITSRLRNKVINNENRPKLTMCAFVPKIGILRNLQNDILPLSDWIFCDVALVSNIYNKSSTPNDIKRLIQAKLCCIFDMALRQRRQESLNSQTLFGDMCWYLECVVLPDLGIRTEKEAKMYVDCLAELLNPATPGYVYQFRHVCVCTHFKPLYHLLVNSDFIGSSLKTDGGFETI